MKKDNLTQSTTKQDIKIPEEGKPIPVLPIDINKNNYEQYSEANKKIPTTYGSDYSIINYYKNGDRVTITFDYISIENPVGTINNWWETREEEKKEIEEIVRKELPTY